MVYHRCRLEAKDYLKQGLRNSAKNCLRRKKSLERKVESREVALETINVMLQRVRDAESNKMVRREKVDYYIYLKN